MLSHATIWKHLDNLSAMDQCGELYTSFRGLRTSRYDASGKDFHAEATTILRRIGTIVKHSGIFRCVYRLKDVPYVVKVNLDDDKNSLPRIEGVRRNWLYYCAAEADTYQRLARVVEVETKNKAKLAWTESLSRNINIQEYVEGTKVLRSYSYKTAPVIEKLNSVGVLDVHNENYRLCKNRVVVFDFASRSQDGRVAA